jgi:hypothetical protein
LAGALRLSVGFAGQRQTTKRFPKNMAEQNPKHRRKPEGIGRIEGRITADGLTHGDRSLGHGTAEPASARPAGAGAGWRVGGLVGRKLAAIGAATACASERYFPTLGLHQLRQAQVPDFTITFRTARAALRVPAFGPVGLLESYFDGNLDIEGISCWRSAPLDAGSTIRRTRWSRCATAGMNPLSNKSIAQARPTPGFTTTWASLSTSSGSTGSA